MNQKITRQMKKKIKTSLENYAYYLFLHNSENQGLTNKDRIDYQIHNDGDQVFLKIWCKNIDGYCAIEDETIKLN